jgi:GNAT superfamily N-acetyltransferase
MLAAQVRFGEDLSGAGMQEVKPALPFGTSRDRKPRQCWDFDVMSEDDIEFKGVDNDRWDDLAALFEARGGPHNCWCMVWRDKPPTAKGVTSGKRKSALKDALRSRATRDAPIGILGYRKGVPIAWCSIAPRSSYRSLGGVDDDDPTDVVWSLVCFFVKREFRGQRFADQLLHAAVDYALGNGAKIIEAYPVDPASPSYRFMGFVNLFERAGFQKVGRAGARRHVMRLDLA